MTSLPPCDHDECPPNRCDKPGSLHPAGSTAPVQRGDKFNAVKVEVNNLMVMYAPETMTIKEADQIACDVVVMITLGKYPVR